MIWNSINQKKPLAYKTGMYEGFMDGSEFCDFYDTRDFEIKNAEYWTELVSPF